MLIGVSNDVKRLNLTANISCDMLNALRYMSCSHPVLDVRLTTYKRHLPKSSWEYNKINDNALFVSTDKGLTLTSLDPYMIKGYIFWST